MVARASAPASAGTAEYLARGWGHTRLWVGIVGPPAIWAARIAAAYVLVPYACWAGQRWLMHLPTIVAVFIAGAMTIDAWRLWRRAGSHASSELGDVLARSRFMAAFGIMNGIFWIMVMLAEELASLYIGPCLTSGHPMRWLGR